jgi:hypothetical protein
MLDKYEPEDPAIWAGIAFVLIVALIALLVLTS